MTTSGRIHSIETLAGHDGRGLRTVVFMQGCPMRCIYCHNPDTLPVDDGEEIEVSDLYGRLMRYRTYFSQNGGVTLSGGEPLLQTEFAVSLFELLKQDGIHTCLDTSGTVITPFTAKLLSLCDQVLLDIKHTDATSFKQITRRNSYGTLMRFLDLCRESSRIHGTELILRQVIVPQITDGHENIKRLKTLAEFSGAKKIELLPYHTAGEAKWKNLGIEYPLKGTLPPSDVSMQKLIKLTGEFSGR